VRQTAGTRQAPVSPETIPTRNLFVAFDELAILTRPQPRRLRATAMFDTLGLAQLFADANDGRRALRIIVRKLAALLLLGDADPEMTCRASGDVLCERCGQTYGRHVQHPHASWLTVLCDGRRVHL
jgi:hypothetical protein